jgi:tetratricopeptide (TPR) repeat protein
MPEHNGSEEFQHGASQVRLIAEERARLTHAAEIAPDKFTVWNNLAAIHFDLGDKTKALDCFGKARERAPISYIPQIDSAIKIARTLSDDPDGGADMVAGDLSSAKIELSTQTLEDPNNKNAWHNLGLFHIAERDYRNAKDCFNRVHAIDPHDGFAVCRLIELSAMLNDLQSVEHWCSILACLPNGEMSAIAFNARALVQCDRYQDAKQLIRDAVRRHPDELEILIACGDVMMVYPNVGLAMANATEMYGQAAQILRHDGNDVVRLRKIGARLKGAQANLTHCMREAEKITKLAGALPVL